MSRSSPLAMDAATFRAVGHHLVDRLADLLASIPDRPVTRGESPAVIRAAIGAPSPLPERGTDPARLLDDTASLLFDHSLFNGHPRFFGYITASPAPIGMLGELLASAVNPNVGAWILSPAATEIESQTVQWIAELIGYPVPCDGLLVSGGNMANLVALWAARVAACDWNVRETGLHAADARRLRIYASAETHTWLQKGADLSGLGTDSIRWIETDRDFCMDVPALRRRIAEDRARGERPFLVVGTAGSVGTGAVDPLGEIAAVCRDEGLWFHVDGAYGAFAAGIEAAPTELGELRLADSVAVDPHKWLYAPLEAGCLLVREPQRLRAAFAYHPPYYRFEGQDRNYIDFGPQNSRGFRALKIWLALRQVGAEGYRAMIAADLKLARVLAEAVERRPNLERLTHALSIVTFRYLPEELKDRADTEPVASYLNTLNQEVLDRIQAGGEIFVSNATVRSRYALRACIVNFHTGEEDVLAVPEVAARVGREVDLQIRPDALRPVRAAP